MRTGARRLRLFARSVLQTVLALSATACVTTNFTQPVASFQQSVNSASTSIGTYFQDLNSLERTVYFANLATDPTLRLEAIDRNGNPTGLTGKVFSAQAVKARMDALALLGLYAQRLADLAGSDPGATFAANVNALGTSLSSLDKTFTQLSTAPPGKSADDPKAAAYVGPISSLVGTLGNMYLDHKRDELIAEAVNRGSPAVNKILDLLESDLNSVVEPLIEADLHVEFGNAVADYNDRKSKLSTEQRAALLTAVGQRADAYYAALDSNPTALIQSIRTANAALVKYANAPKTPQNLSQFLSALQTLAQSAREVADEVNKIRAIS